MAYFESSSTSMIDTALEQLVNHFKLLPDDAGDLIFGDRVLYGALVGPEDTFALDVPFLYFYDMEESYVSLAVETAHDRGNFVLSMLYVDQIEPEQGSLIPQQTALKQRRQMVRRIINSLISDVYTDAPSYAMTYNIGQWGIKWGENGDARVSVSNFQTGQNKFVQLIGKDLPNMWYAVDIRIPIYFFRN